MAGEELGGESEVEGAEHLGVLVLERGEPGEVFVGGFSSGGSQVVDGVVHVLGVPEDEDVQGEAEGGELVFLALAVGLA